MKNEFFKKIFIFFILFFQSLTLGIYDINQAYSKNNLIYLAVIGSGPAGLSAGLYGARSGIHTVVFEGPKPGGQIFDSILVENWPGVTKAPGAVIMNNLKKQALSFGLNIEPDTIEKVNFSTWPFILFGKQKKYHALAVIIATGALPRKLGIPGENTYWSKGILSCGLCDAHLAKNQDVVIIGGGDTAIERILQLAPYAKSILLVVRDNCLHAAPFMQNKIKEFNHLKIMYNSEVREFIGNNKRLTGVKIYNKINKKNYVINASWAFLSIGFEPNAQIFKKELKLDSEGYIKHSCQTQETEIEGIFVAGNVSDPRYKQASTASGDATKAALNSIKFLRQLSIDKKKKKKLEKNLFFPKKLTYKNIIDINSNTSNKKNFEKNISNIIEKEKKLVLIEFYSPLCSTCLQMDESIKLIANEFKNNLKVFKINLNKNPGLAKKYNIKATPAFLIISNGSELHRYTGKIEQNKLKSSIKEILQKNN